MFSSLSVRALVSTSGLAAITTGAAAVDLAWMNAAGGPASTVTNWNPTQAPTAADALRFSLAGTYSVTFSGAVAAAASHSYEAGIVTAMMSSDYVIGGPLTVSGPAATAPTANMQGSGGLALTTTVQGTLTLGSAAATGGTLQLIGNGTSSATRTWNIAGAASVGRTGTGTLLLTNGAVLNALAGCTTGELLGSSSTLSLSGAPGTFALAKRCTLAVTGDLTLSSRGQTNATISQGALCTATDDVFVAAFHSSNSTLDISTTATNGRPAELLVNDGLFIGRNDTVAVAGTGLVRVGVGGRAIVTGQIGLGDLDGSSLGTLRIEGGTVECAGLHGAGNRGRLELVNGTLTVRAGGIIGPGLSAYILDGAAPTDNPVMIIDEGARFETGGSTSIRIGNANKGTIRARNGSAIDLQAGFLRLAATPTGVGIAEITGAGSRGVFAGVYVGESGSGEFTLGHGAIIEDSSIYVAQSPGSSGVAVIHGAGTLFRATGSTIIAGGNSTPGGAGRLSIADDARLESLNVVRDTRVWDGGEASVESGGLWLSAATINLRGLLSLDAGTVEAPLVLLNGPGRLSGVGLVAARISSEEPTSISARPSERSSTLTLGADEPDGISLRGTLDVVDATVELIDANGAALARTDIGGGTLRCESGLFTAAGTSLSGNGIIDADFTPAGDVRADETGLTFERRVTGFGEGFTGGTIRFGPRADAQGAGFAEGHWYNGGVFSPGPGIGTLRIDGLFANVLDTDRTPGVIAIDIAGTQDGEFDTLDITDTLTLAGTLAVRLDPAFQSSENARFIIARAGTVAGVFDALDLPPGFAVDYGSTAVVLYFTPPPCPADFNQDGGIDGGDVEAFFAAWENGEPSSDVNQDGGIDGADVETFFAAWEAGGCV